MQDCFYIKDIPQNHNLLFISRISQVWNEEVVTILLTYTPPIINPLLKYNVSSLINKIVAFQWDHA